MQPRDASTPLGGIAAVRALQRLRAETDARAASAALDEAQVAVSAADAGIADALDGWQVTTRAAGFDPAAAARWIAAVSVEQTLRADHVASRTWAEHRVRAALDRWHASRHRAEQADRAYAEARRAERRRRGERAAQAALERHVARRDDEEVRS